MANHLRRAGARPRPCLPLQCGVPNNDTGSSAHASPAGSAVAPTWEELLGRR